MTEIRKTNGDAEGASLSDEQDKWRQQHIVLNEEQIKQKHEEVQELKHDLLSLIARVCLHIQMLSTSLAPIDAVSQPEKLDASADMLMAYKQIYDLLKQTDQIFTSISQLNRQTYYKAPDVVKVNGQEIITYNDNTLAVALSTPTSSDSIHALYDVINSVRTSCNMPVLDSAHIATDVSPQPNALVLFIKEIKFYIDQVKELIDKVKIILISLNNFEEAIPIDWAAQPKAIVNFKTMLEQSGGLKRLDANVEEINTEVNEVIETGMIDVERELEQLNIVAFLRDLIDVIRNQYHDMPLITLDGLSDEITIATNPTALKIVLTNLITNAIKYGVQKDEQGVMHGMPVTVLLSADEEVVRIAVIDQGIGIDPNDLDKLRNQTQSVRLANAVAARISGTGFGLNRSQKQIRKLGGRLEIESAGLNQGSTFTVVLPRSSK